MTADLATQVRQSMCGYHQRKPKYPSDPQPAWIQGVCAFCGVSQKEYEAAEYVTATFSGSKSP